MKAFKKKWAIPAAALVLTLSIAGGAYAATSGSSTVTTGATGTTVAGQTQCDANGGGRCGQRGDETLLTGDVLEKVKAAALANLGAGATVIRAETDADSNAKYEVHATKADGTMVMVYIDESYKVVSVETCGNGAGMGRGRMGGGDSDEVALTGDTLTQVTNAALAAAGTGSTLMRATTDDDGIAKYEAHVRKADGTCVNIYLDESFKVVKTETAEQGDGMGRGRMGGGRMGGDNGRCQNGAGTTGTTAAPNTSTTGSI
jgi:hypothetical protein